MAKIELLEKYSKLIVEVGANVQKDQLVVINSSTETRELARLLVNAAYNAGAKKVIVSWSDEFVSRSGYEGMSIETLKEVPQYSIDRLKHFVDQGACVISITSPIPGLNAGVDPNKMQTSSIASRKNFKFYSDHMMGNRTQWCVVAAPNKIWAKKIFPNLNDNDAFEALWDAILGASRVTETNDPIEEWEKHNVVMLAHNKVLNDYQFDTLHFKNSLGTDLVVKIVDNHIWAGGGEFSTKGIYFNPNIPTEENFTMPDKFNVNGKVVATKPLNYQGNLIEDFWLEFENGKVVSYDAKKQKETLKNLLDVDEGSKYIGEVALISHDSPISNLGILFLNTLFDENASCHLALGRAYPMNVAGGNDMTPEELAEAGSNQSMIHTDFMFGSEDMSIIGTQKNGKEVTIFKNGNFVI